MELSKAYRIETERLVIRCYEPSDAPKLKDAIAESLDHLRPWMPWAKNEPEGVSKAFTIPLHHLRPFLPFTAKVYAIFEGLKFPL